MSSRQSRNKQSGFKRHLLVLGLIIGVSIFAFFKLSQSKVAATGTIIESGIKNYCLDDYKNGSTIGNKVESWNCNGSAAQDWSVDGTKIEHNSACLGVQADKKEVNSPIILSNCSNNPGQLWLKDGGGFFNPNSDMCLTVVSPNQQLVILPCNDRIGPNQTWIVSSLGGKLVDSSKTCNGSEGELVACYAEREWSIWQSGSTNHNDLLYKYTDGTPSEAWCADFVSYVYKEAGYPFTEAYDGWNENNANNIQNYRFTIHAASSDYVPKPGDIAFFDYNAGHVEIVISGGKNPTFIYGNSATIDPATGNGQMKANTIIKDGPEGQLIYYLSPD